MSLVDSQVIVARHITLTGRVQGIGMRPAIARWAEVCGVCGHVHNSHRGVEVHIEGPATDVEQFCDELRAHVPAAARIERVIDRPANIQGLAAFAIDAADASDSLSAQVPPDVAVCNDCLRDVADPANRRHGYLLTSCTTCGPRYSVVEAMPYERPATSMQAFPPCEDCRREYQSPDDRRFHAQTISCPQCGPNVWLTDSAGRKIAAADAAVDLAVQALRKGRIVALRGIGGYQLLVDATSDAAVERLRRRKQRPAKPLAVMVADVESARRLAVVNSHEQDVLTSPANPIIVLSQRAESGLAPAIHRGVGTVGLMLPTTPLHWMLARQFGRPLVVTSGNVEGQPLVAGVDEAERELAGVADLFLHHNRPIARPIDDSVVRSIAGRAVTLRLGRGLAPLVLDVPSASASIRLDLQTAVALGGHMKSAFALHNGRQAVLGSHVGELEHLRTRERFVEQLRQLTELYGIEAECIAHDRHPDYFTTRLAAEHGARRIGVWHHHAHVVAGMLEHGWLDRQVLGVALDGTGFGPDGTIWGGEFLLSTTDGFRRAAHLRPFRLLGGEAAVREPWRLALALFQQSRSTEAAAQWINRRRPEVDATAALAALSRNALSPPTTSAGRLFDGVASLVLGLDRAEFDGQAPMLLEAVCDESEPGTYDIPLTNGTPFELDWRPLIDRVLCDVAVGVSPGAVAMRFHRALAAAIVNVCRRWPALPVVLGGGVFQNRVLIELIIDQWDAGLGPLGLPGIIPPGDGGLAAGQLVVALAEMAKGASAPCA